MWTAALNLHVVCKDEMKGINQNPKTGLRDIALCLTGQGGNSRILLLLMSMSAFSFPCYRFRIKELSRSGSVNALAEGLNTRPPLTVPRDQNQSSLPSAVGMDLTGLCALQMPCLKTEVRGRDSNKDINGYWTGHLKCLKQKLLEWHATVYSS